MKHLIPKTMTAVPVLALALAVGGCGGSSSSSDDMVTEPPAPMPDPAIAQRADINTKIMAASTAVHAVNDDSTDMQVTGAETAIAAAKKAVMDAADVPADEKAAHNSTITQLETTLMNAKSSRSMAMSDAAKAAAKDAMALFAGMNDATGDLALASVAVTDEYGGSATITATTSGPVDAGNADLTVSTVKATDTAVPSLGMWKGTELAGANTAGTASSTVVVYTDIEAPKPVAFDKVYTVANGVLGGTSGEANAWLQHTDNRSKIKAAEFMHTGMKDHGADATSADNVNVMIRGTFNGASGEYRCTAAAAAECVSHDAGKGAVRLVGTWVFDPDSGAMAMQADAVYASFGWWLHKDDVGGPEVAVFHSITGETALTGTDFTALGGTATYKGAAAGKYAINPGLSAASGGHWTADATLTADFGSESENGSISGMVDNFMAGGEMMDWSVALGKVTFATANDGTFTSAGDGATTAGDDVVWTVGGVDGAEAGSWSGALREAGDNNVPTLATGQFSAAHGTVGHMVGAFGAHLE